MLILYMKDEVSIMFLPLTIVNLVGKERNLSWGVAEKSNPGC